MVSLTKYGLHGSAFHSKSCLIFITIISHYEQKTQFIAHSMNVSNLRLGDSWFQKKYDKKKNLTNFYVELNINMKTLVSLKGEAENCDWEFKWEIANKIDYNGNPYFNISLIIRGWDSTSIGQRKNLIANSLRAYFLLWELDITTQCWNAWRNNFPEKNNLV